MHDPDRQLSRSSFLLTLISFVLLGHWYSNKYPTSCNVTQFIYFWKLLYIFRVVSPPIIRSTQLYVHHLVLVKPLLLPTAIVEELELQFVPDAVDTVVYVLLMMGGDTTRNT